MTRRFGDASDCGQGAPRWGRHFLVRLAFLTSNRTAILKLDPHGKTVTIDVEGDVNVLGVRIWAVWVMEARDFAASQNEPTYGVGIA
jgi:hypothetical protein